MFQNLAVSLLAQKYNLVAHYDMIDEFRALGFRLHSGSRRLDPSYAVPLDDKVLRHLLENSATSTKRGFRIEHPYSYFQTPWFATVLRSTVIPSMRASLLAANQWRDRFGANNDTCVHMRLGTYKDPIPPVSAHFFEDIDAAIGTPTGSVFIATDNATAAGVVALLRKFNAVLLHPRDYSAVQTVQFIASCRRLVLTDGTMGWLAGTLAFQSSVRYVPRPQIWHGDIYVFSDWERFGGS